MGVREWIRVGERIIVANRDGVEDRESGGETLALVDVGVPFSVLFGGRNLSGF